MASARLTPREAEILCLASKGYIDKEIASALNVSANTVTTYWLRIKRKLGAATRGEAIASAARAEARRAIQSTLSDFEKLESEVRSAMQEKGFAELKFRALIDAVPDGVLIVDEQFIVRDANACAAEYLGWRQDELVGMELAALIPERFRPAHDAHQRDYMKKPRKRPMGTDLELYARRADGLEIPIDAVLYPQRIGKRPMSWWWFARWTRRGRVLTEEDRFV
jgi:PAS domain S-box-containing protein